MAKIGQKNKPNKSNVLSGLMKGDNMHKHENKSHRMQLIDLCAEILAYQKLDLDWRGKLSDFAREILSILTIDSDKLEERIDVKIKQLTR